MRNSAHSAIMHEAAVCSRMKPRPITVALTCSPRPRARTGGGRNNEHWRREPFHIQISASETACGLDCTDWLRLEPRDLTDALSDRHCCMRCAKALPLKDRLARTEGGQG